MAVPAARGLLPLMLLASLGCGQASPEPTVAPRRSYLERRSELETNLVRRGPAPQSWQVEPVPQGVKEVRYQSGDLALKAWLAVPTTGKGERWPAVVYFHGGWAFGASDYHDCAPFLRAGYVVLCPMLRGENGNPGNFELFYGEVEDAIAAIRTLAAQPGIDPERIHAFGHSAGGGIAALLSLFDDIPLAHSGSCGGLYDVTTFAGWSDIVPFDLSRQEEKELRVLLGNLRYMKRPHYAFLGTEDSFQGNIMLARAEMTGLTPQLEIIQVPGDHMSSLQPAMERYLRVIGQGR